MYKISPLFLYFNTTPHSCLSVNNRVTHFNGEAIIGADYRAAFHVTLHNIITSAVLLRVTFFFLHHVGIKDYCFP